MVGARAAMAAVSALVLTAGSAAGETVPLPRVKPADLTAAEATALPPAHPAPLPRVKPAELAGGAAPSQPVALPAETALITSQSGSLTVALDRLGRERDPDQSAELAPQAGSGWPAVDIVAAETRCNLVLASTNLDAVRLDPIGGPGGCGIAAPIEVASFGAIAVKPAVKLNCTMAAATYKWLTEVVQPAARDTFGKPVVGIRSLSSYTCRRRNNETNTRISEHAFGNALDIATFELAGGETVSVEGDWNSLLMMFGGRAAFLKRLHEGACETFSTVLGPRADRAHENHFHVDLGRGGRNKYCR